MKVCAVVQCNAKQYTDNLSFLRFPVDDLLRKKWLISCGLSENFDSKEARVCSNHFSNDDFERDLRAELMGIPQKRRLKPTAEPHLNLVRIKDEPVDADNFQNEEGIDNSLPYIVAIAASTSSESDLDNTHFEDGTINQSNMETESVPSRQIQITPPLKVTLSPASSSVNCVQASLPASENWPGPYEFAVSFRQQEKNVKGVAWTYSKAKDKLYVRKDAPCPISFSTNAPLPDGFSIRALALYSSPANDSEVVHRCVNHSMDELAQGIFEAEHLVRCETSRTTYEVNKITKRHSVIVPFENPEDGQHYSTYIYKFACFGSCAGGPNRRPIMLIFLLEKGEHVVGRRRLDLKICACPGRDCKLEEQQMGIAGTSQMPLKRKEPNSSTLEVPRYASVPMAKKTKIAPPTEGPFTIRCIDKEQFEFLIQVKKYDEISRFMSNLPPTVKKALAFHSSKKGYPDSDN